MKHFAHSGKLGGITLPLEIFRDPRLSGADIKFLVALIEHRNKETGKVNPGANAIAAVSGLGLSSIKRARLNLVKYGWMRYTSGDTKTTNDYTIIIPLEAGFKYHTRAQRMENEKWETEVNRRERDAKSYATKRKRADNQWYLMGQKELLEELEIEKKDGVRYIPDEALEMFEILREGDNSEDARWSRKLERDAAEAAQAAERKASSPGGVQDPYAGEYDPEDFIE